jgi:hypothetical protein
VNIAAKVRFHTNVLSVQFLGKLQQVAPSSLTAETIDNGVLSVVPGTAYP